MLGPWPHGVGGRACGQADFGESAAVRVNELAIAWFDHWLQGKPLERIGPEPVHIFRMGGGDGSRKHGQRNNSDLRTAERGRLFRLGLLPMRSRTASSSAKPVNSCVRLRRNRIEIVCL